MKQKKCKQTTLLGSDKKKFTLHKTTKETYIIYDRYITTTQYRIISLNAMSCMVTIFF